MAHNRAVTIVGLEFECLLDMSDGPSQAGPATATLASLATGLDDHGVGGKFQACPVSIIRVGDSHIQHLEPPTALGLA